MIDERSPDRTAGELLETLRVATGRADIAFDRVPVPLMGGFYADMLRFSIVDPPPGLDGELVARLVPDPAAGAWEATIQRDVAEQGFPTPAVRLTAPESGPLGRYLIVMDLVDGSPPMSGLSTRVLLTEVPGLLRHLPGELARCAADLHALDPGPLGGALAALPTPFPLTTAGFVEQLRRDAAEVGRADLDVAAKRLLASEPASETVVISHGDLHPFNLLQTADGPVLIDWTVARIAHPGFTVGFTHLLLSNPPIPLPGAARPAMRAVGRGMARRFLSRYRRLTDGTPGEVSDEQLDWHRQVHALRILVEKARWHIQGLSPEPGHPWYTLEPFATKVLGLHDRRGK